MRLFLIFSIVLLIGCGKEREVVKPEIQTQESYQRVGSPTQGGQIFERQINITASEFSTLFQACIKSKAIELWEDDIPIFIVRNIAGEGNLILYCGGISSIEFDHMGIKIQGKKILGPQQPAIANASGWTDTERKLNLLLEACREHGLIDRLSEN